MAQTIQYTDLDGKPQTRQLYKDEYPTDSLCPIDSQPLIEQSSDNGTRTEISYHCPCCSRDFYHTDSKNLEREKTIIISGLQERLVESQRMVDHINKILAHARKQSSVRGNRTERGK